MENENENKIDNKTDIVSDTEPKATAKSKSTTGTKSATGAKSKSTTGTKSATGAKSKSATGAKSKSATGTKSAAGTKSSSTAKKSASTAKPKSSSTKSKTADKPKAEAAAGENSVEVKEDVAAETATVTETPEVKEEVAVETADMSEAPESEPAAEEAAAAESQESETAEQEPQPKSEKIAESKTEEVEHAAAAATASKAKPASKLKISVIGILAVLIAVAVILVSVILSCRGNTKYTVTFDTRGGSSVASYKLEAGERINRPSVTPKKEMFVFYDWFTDTNFTEKFTFGTKMPKNNITIYAGWIGEASVEITLDANGGEFAGGGAEYKLYGDVGASFAMPSVKPTKSGYAFGGWYTDSECTESYTFTVYPVDNLTLYASWVKDAAYAYVSYYGNGLLLSEVPVLKNTVLSEPDMFGSDIISAGWYTDEDMTDSYTFGEVITGDISLYTTYYTDGLQIKNGVVTGYYGNSANVIVPNKYDGTTVTEIGAYAFYRTGEATNITSVSLPSTIAVVAEGAFYDCQYLVGVGLTEGVISIGDNAFYKNYRLKTVGDISSVIEIGDAAFIGCKVLGNLTLSTSLEYLGAYAFTDCATITGMVIPSAIQTVPDYLFSGCTALKNVEFLSARLDTIGTHAFENCKALELVTIRSTIPATIEDENGISTFNGLDKVKIKVHSASLDFYRTEYSDLDFGTLADKFEAI